MVEKKNLEEFSRGLIIGLMSISSTFLVMFLFELLIDLINWGIPNGYFRTLLIVVFLLVTGYLVIKILMNLFDKAIINRFEIFPSVDMKGNFFKRYK
ncbi:hypothetical protein LCGC14_3105900 [marine sediment metagenome]|uniref:Uncharacterized protein n=1 Tax=marine sediment metagenome TaxID=412755 RepID=A0A0F8WV87_9ZZZZ